jgi:hypothetical protein
MLMAGLFVAAVVLPVSFSLLGLVDAKVARWSVGLAVAASAFALAQTGHGATGWIHWVLTWWLLLAAACVNAATGSVIIRGGATLSVAWPSWVAGYLVARPYDPWSLPVYTKRFLVFWPPPPWFVPVGVSVAVAAVFVAAHFASPKASRVMCRAAGLQVAALACAWILCRP